jgi:hypothetical protein
MSTHDLYNEILIKINRGSLFHRRLEKNKEIKIFEDSLFPIMEILKFGMQADEPLLHNDLHQACINFDQERLAKSDKEKFFFDKMLSENGGARPSIELIMDAQEYRKHVERVYGPNRKILFPPPGEPCLTTYKNHSRQIGHLKKGAASLVVKEYFNTRQHLISVSMSLIVDLQCRSLGISPPNKRQGQDKNLAHDQ